MFVQSLRQSSCSQSNNWCSNFQTCDLNQRCWRMTMNHAIKLPSKTLLSEETHSTIKLSKIKTVTPMKTVTSSFGFIICWSAELRSKLCHLLVLGLVFFFSFETRTSLELWSPGLPGTFSYPPVSGCGGQGLHARTCNHIQLPHLFWSCFSVSSYCSDDVCLPIWGALVYGLLQ